MFYIKQIQNDDCGFACLKMLLAEINKDKDYLFLPQDEKHGPYSLMQLVGIASNYGVALSAFRATDKTTVSNCLNFPFIAIIRLKNGGKHALFQQAGRI